VVKFENTSLKLPNNKKLQFQPTPTTVFALHSTTPPNLLHGPLNPPQTMVMNSQTSPLMPTVKQLVQFHVSHKPNSVLTAKTASAPVITHTSTMFNLTNTLNASLI
jgi:hypothetical protein